MGQLLIARALAVGLVLAGASVAGCASAPDPAHTADSITRAIYANDLDATVATFDDETKKTVTRADVGALSDKMHALGTLDALAARSANADTGRYVYDARFTNGAMRVEMRLDPSGKVGAYRVTPESPEAANAK